jgi:predicted flavoprotein YhiN
LSALLAFEKISQDSPLRIVLLPEADVMYDQRIVRLNEAVVHSPKKEIRTIMKQRFAERMAVAILDQCGIPADTVIASMTKEMKKVLANYLSG